MVKASTYVSKYKNGGGYVSDSIIKILDAVINSNAPRSFRDPQEYISGLQRNEASDVYSYGMMIFREITGKDYFEAVSIPEDEYFMSCDTETDFSVICPENIPADYHEISDLLCKMTMFRRESRISLNEIEKLLNDNKNVTEPVAEKDNIQENQANSQTEIFPKYREGFDYGVIVNNKRCGRIEFIELYSSQNNKNTYYDIPVHEQGEFKIPVSARRTEYKNITNPSSVYGDCIIPTAMIKMKAEKCHAVRVVLDKEDDNMIISVSMTDINGNVIGSIGQDQLEVIPYIY